MRYLFAEAMKALNIHSGWIVWNLFLAFIPLALSFWLFRSKSQLRSVLWWLGFLVFAAFLPNAPYLLTDIIHLINATREGFSVWVITLVLIPQHLLAILAGFEAYVISLINLGHYLRRQGAGQMVLTAELITHALSAVGVYLGRFRRFNSWDLITKPEDVVMKVLDDLTAKRPVLVIAVTFVILTVFYWLIKQVTLAIILRVRQRNSDHTSS
ncbi:MAG: DUF1361 domain-containing protein [Symploca sp. SIO3C6]|uniref:DUF1361 domain-containing protein n=1 Tax=Symploca sp. SIO1C4 TaxID=2607765 RepID=A0A6B3NEC2_9CYAN|nr:DUF1361 domain-containing protein [Symploca sp. SIO3C6]NER29265.1 DUF1361 domain-containing protein [Symploca sp. SIO1C4]NET04548.1 DUF1361 domain-containing protein [Symploca sp. SIO2B6]NET52386.1 DUF1361 domain-containing protein [Merismopedia sp. SIO2A8]